MELQDSAKLEETRLDVINGNKMTSFSGADFLVLGYRPQEINEFNEPAQNLNGDDSTSRFVEFANVQTLSVSSTRDVYAERVLGTSWVRRYQRGGRTVAGSIAFTMFDGDSFRLLAGAREGTTREDLRYYIPDDIPEFNLVLTASNEYGQTISGILLGITLVNSGTTVGVQDVFTEQMFSYVAKRWIPFVGTVDLGRSLSNIFENNPKLKRILRNAYAFDEWVPPTLRSIDQASEANGLRKIRIG